MPKMSGTIVAQRELRDSERDEMYALFSHYYDQTSRARFDEDLERKDHVILLYDHERRIQGFSTMKHLVIRCGNKRHRGLFSGDTVVAEAFWGQRVLGKLFLRHLFLEKAKHPLEPYWWMLISKGYKTYLLMANNFAEHYPRYETPTPGAAQEILDVFASELFGPAYCRQTGLIEFEHSLGQLKPGVAHIDAEMLENPRIRFFVEHNRGWQRGTELACIARMTWSMPMYYAAKAAWKYWGRGQQQSGAQPSRVGR